MIDGIDPSISAVRGQLRRQLSRDGFDYWNAIRQGRKMPLRADFHPFDIPQLLPSIILLEVMGPERDFLYRVVGTRWVEEFGRNYARCLMSELEHQKAPSLVWSAVSHVVDTQLPNAPSLPYVGQGSPYKDIEVVIMPMSREGRSVDYLLVVIDFVKDLFPEHRKL